VASASVVEERYDSVFAEGRNIWSGGRRPTGTRGTPRRAPDGARLRSRVSKRWRTQGGLRRIDCQSLRLSDRACQQTWLSSATRRDRPVRRWARATFHATWQAAADGI